MVQSLLTRRFLFAFLTLIGLGLGIGFGAVPGLAQESETRIDLRLLHLNDVYEISPKGGQGGLAEIMTLVRAERGGAKNSLFTFGGDLLSPSLLSAKTQGAHMIDLFNAMGVDLAGLGNHEFDFGPENLQARLAESRFPWLAANVTRKDGQPFAGLAPIWVREIDGIKIGAFALLTPEASVESSPGPDIVIAPVQEAAKAAIAALKEQGADVILALTHMALSEDRALAKANPDIDVILGGHDHDPISIYEGGALILKAGYDAHYLAVADLTIVKKVKDKDVRVSVLPAWRFLTSAGAAPDAEIAAKIAPYNEALDKELGVPLGTTETDLDSQRASVRTGEANMGNLIADAMRVVSGAEIALANGGGIRGDKVYPAGAVLTKKDILTELPFGNILVVVDIAGADLLAALENGVSKIEDKAGRFPQVSGMKVVFDARKPAGSRIVSVKIGEADLDPAKTYRLATNDYLLDGGDGYGALKKGTIVLGAKGGPLLAGAVMDYIAKLGKIAIGIEGRIIQAP